MNGQSISTSHYEDSDIRSIFERNRAYTITGKAALTAGIRPREGASLSLLACNEIREEELVSRSELTKSLIDNGFNQASVTFLVPVITTELGGSRTLVDMSVRSDYKSSYYRVIYYYKASMQLTKSFVEPTPEFVSEVRAALTPPNTLDKYKALLGVFQKFGYVWAQKVTVGGRITVSEIISEHQSDREKKFNAFAEAKASVNGTITGFGKAGFGAGFTTQTDQGSINAADFSNQRNRVRIIGGRPTSATLDDRTSWEKSLQHEPSTWEVILREDLIPICELLDDDLLAQVVNVMEDTLKVERITSEIKLNMRNVKTKFSLGWKQLYYGHSKGNKGMVVSTSPPISDDDNLAKLWMIVKRPYNHNKSPYICFGDVVYIQPATNDTNEKNLFLHGSHSQDAPVSKGAAEVSLRFFSHGPNENDEWTILPCDDHPGAEIDLDATMRKRSYLTKYDIFKLRHKVTDNHYLSSHKVTMENIRIRRNPSEKTLFPLLLKDKTILGPFASRLNEVLMLDMNQIQQDGGGSDLWEVIPI